MKYAFAPFQYKCIHCVLHLKLACLVNIICQAIDDLYFVQSELSQQDLSKPHHTQSQLRLTLSPKIRTAQVFSRCGDVQRIIMGLDKQKKTPCGFCFVVYYTRRDAEDAVKYLSGTKVDERPIRVDFDWGFVEGRQFGRGRAGGQVDFSHWHSIALFLAFKKLAKVSQGGDWQMDCRQFSLVWGSVVISNIIHDHDQMAFCIMQCFDLGWEAFAKTAKRLSTC